jgi:hypothetical protein
MSTRITKAHVQARLIALNKLLPGKGLYLNGAYGGYAVYDEDGNNFFQSGYVSLREIHTYIGIAARIVYMLKGK